MAKQGNFDIDIPPQDKIIAFARHETFHPRFGWLKKGFDGASSDSSVFLAKDVTVRLGVGKNMVRSIRYWCDAFKVLKNDQTTDFGDSLLGTDGWDPFLEDPASLWLLHWKLLEATCSATAWFFVFNHIQKTEFTVEDLFYQISDYLEQGSVRVAESSIKKDINCILRMYVSQDVRSSFNEDSLDCPFVDLGLIQRAGDSRHYTFRFGGKPSLPNEIIVYSCLSYAATFARTARSIPISRLLYEVGSPGMVFKLTESALCGAIEAVGRQNRFVGLEDSAGLIQLTFDREPGPLAMEVVDNYYKVWGENAA